MQIYLDIELFRKNSTASINTIRDRYKKNRKVIGTYYCDLCGNCGKYNEKELSLHFEHIDGDRRNNEIDNLQLLCPNCHSQTDTFCLNKGRRKFDLTQLQSMINDGYSVPVISKQLNISRSAVYYKIDQFKLPYKKRKCKKRASLQYIFSETSVVRRSTLKHLFRQVIKCICAECGINECWNGKPLDIQLHHKNEVNTDNRLINLEWLCPNCHNQHHYSNIMVSIT